jgi:hypothetical protein
MSTFKLSARAIQGALLFSALLTGFAATSLLAQQAQEVTAPAPTAATVIPATPAPASSALFARTDDNAPTIAAARTANAAALVQENHTIVVSTLVLVLGIVILVLLIG